MEPRFRGPTLAAAICDEIGFWATDATAAYRDVEVLEALKPALSTTDGPLICLSSPWRREGALWNAYDRYHGAPSDGVLAWHASTRTMNPSFPVEVIERAERLDPVWAATEYAAQFRDDAGGYLTWDIVERSICKGVTKRRPDWEE